MPGASSLVGRGGALNVGTGGAALAAPFLSVLSDLDGEADSSLGLVASADGATLLSSAVLTTSTVLISGMIISNFFLYKFYVILSTLSSMFALYNHN